MNNLRMKLGKILIHYWFFCQHFNPHCGYLKWNWSLFRSKHSVWPTEYAIRVKFVFNPVPPNMCFLTFFAEVTSFPSEIYFLGVYFIINLQFTLLKPTRTYKNVQDSPQNAGPLNCTLRKMRISLQKIAQCFFNFGHSVFVFYTRLCL